MGLFKRHRELGPLLLGVWLIASGVTSVLNFTIPFSGPLLALVAIAAGVLILLGR
jgi:uncharacterized protein YhhL (DUF1145 family)